MPTEFLDYAAPEDAPNFGNFQSFWSAAETKLFQSEAPSETSF